MPRTSLIVASILAAAAVASGYTGQQAAAAEARPELLVADFEGADYGAWKTEGEAFGPGPARGTLPKQMAVAGFEGKGLVNSFFRGDGTTGTLTSPPVKIERRYVNFLIGGGGHEGRTCINLLVAGKVVRTAAGPNLKPGGSETLDWHSWDVAEFEGKEAVFQIVDQATGGWGHINVDHIIQSDRKRGAAEPAEREMTVTARYLHLPVKNNGRKCWLRLVVDGRFEREFEIELAEGEPDFWTFTDIVAWKGRRLKLEVDRLPAGSRGLAAIVQADEVPDAAAMYKESLRPQFHFTPRRGWTNDPNGLVYYDGEYHLFFQHNPYGVKWGNMTWGQAVSKDLLHWTELPDAIHPDALGTIFSGSAVVDEHNTTGWQTGPDKPLVCIYTSAGGTNRASRGVPFSQSIAWSADRGRTWTKYDKNPVLANVHGGNRDPKVFWHAPGKQWVMLLYLDRRGEFGLFGSPDLKQWTKLSDLAFPEGHECPDLFELPVDGDAAKSRWVAWEAGGRYLLGRFDGRTFTAESGPHPTRFGANDYAAQTYSDIPAADGRRIQIAWMQGGKYPEMPFNQQMSVPRELSLRTTPAGIRLCFAPIREIERLRGKRHAWKDLALRPDGENPLAQLAGELFDIEAEFEPGAAAKVGLLIRGQKIEYTAADKQLTALGRTAPLPPLAGRVKLRILVDRASVEVFADDGLVQMATCFVPPADDRALAAYAQGGDARLPRLEIWELKSTWTE